MMLCESKNAEDDGYNHTPIHCYCLDENIVWAQIMEKAYAKLHAGYDGFQGLGLHEVTGSQECTVRMFHYRRNETMGVAPRATPSQMEIWYTYGSSKAQENPIHSGMLPSRML